uniref:(northern house mosquito) hypothetical protein n=1 Tax=Culex pipiens TaxID=7175 RepID=A0A8D8EXZ8_CULPI
MHLSHGIQHQMQMRLIERRFVMYHGKSTAPLDILKHDQIVPRVVAIGAPLGRSLVVPDRSQNLRVDANLLPKEAHFFHHLALVLIAQWKRLDKVPLTRSLSINLNLHI